MLIHMCAVYIHFWGEMAPNDMEHGKNTLHFITPIFYCALYLKDNQSVQYFVEIVQIEKLDSFPFGKKPLMAR